MKVYFNATNIPIIAYELNVKHEKYLQRKDWKHNVIQFSALNHDGHFVDNIIDERIDLNK